MHTPIYTPGQIREAERPLIEQLGSTLMRRAAFAVFVECARVLRSRGTVSGAQVLVLAGSGNNGGDALYAAVELQKRGAQVSVWRTGSTVHEAIDMLSAPRLVHEAGHPDVVIDGIVGIGARGALAGEAARAAQAVKGMPVVAVDIPSGVDPMTGITAGDHITACTTVTFGGLKPAHILGWQHCGKVTLSTLGIDEHLSQPWGWSAGIGEWPEPGPTDHKYTHGVVGIYAGSPQFPGAAVLCVEGAARATSSMVRYLGPCVDQVIAARPEVVTGAGRTDAVVVGPGMTDPPVAQLLAQEKPLVLDAGALTAIAENHTLRTQLSGRQGFTVLTPHEGEFIRLLGRPITDRVADARELANELGCVVLLKGHVTVITDGAEVYLVRAESSWAATAGSGDVLAGVIGKAIAWRASISAVATAARLHALAAADGPLVAGDIARALPRVRTTIHTHGLAHYHH